MSYEWSLNKALKAHNRDLYARRCKDGVYRVFQKVKQWREHWISDGQCIRELYDSEWVVCPLTHNWAASGRPVEWGIEPVLEHIKYGRPDMDETRDKEFSKQEELRERANNNDLKNMALVAAEDMYESSKKAFADIRYSNMDLTNDVRKKWDVRRK